MKKFLLWLLTLTIALPSLARDFQYTYKGQTLTYTVIDETAKTCSAKKTIYEITGVLEIPSTASDGTNDFSVTSIGDYAFRYCSGLTSVTIPNSVTLIGESAFYGCSNMAEFTIEDGDSPIAFATIAFYLSPLKNLYIGRNLKDTESNPFGTGISSVTLGDKVTALPNYVFSGCSGLTSVTIPDSVTSIGHYAFSGCSGLTSVIIPNSVTSIGQSAFKGCSGLTSVIIGNSVASINSDLFQGCSNIAEFTIEDGDSLITLANSALS